MTKFDGKCHCGAVEWQVELPEDSQSHILCHCDACKLQSGGEFTLNQIAPKDNLKLTKGDLKVYTYKGDSGNPVDCYFCANCTSSPYHHQVSFAFSFEQCPLTNIPCSTLSVTRLLSAQVC